MLVFVANKGAWGAWWDRCNVRRKKKWLVRKFEGIVIYIFVDIVRIKGV
jgi:hypothetical protein